MTQSPLITIKNLRAGYGKKDVFSGLDFQINDNEVLGLIGLNGIGKTTLIKTILGLREPLAGDVTFHDVAKGKERENISYLPERFDPPWFLSGYEFVKFTLKLYRKKVSYDDVVAAANTVSLNPEFLNKRVQSYSKGMRQKLGLMATILTKCPLLILDEPMSGLDPKARFEVKKLIMSAKEEGRSIFMSSHILSDMAELCDRVVVLNDGEFAFTGTPAQMLKEGKSKSMEEAFLNVINADSDKSKKAA